MTLDQLINIFWLRPETAMWRELDIRAMKDFKFQSPSLDLGCGDGLFSFLRAGGKFDLHFDAFQSMSNLDRYFQNVDAFDSFDISLSPTVVKKPTYKIDVAFDHKKNLLAKAAKLGLYHEYKEGDGNEPLPFKNESFHSIFSNIIYWLDDPKKVFSEIFRILAPGGQACFMLPNKTMPDFSFYNTLYVKTKNPNWKFLEKLDRGRFSDNIRQARSQKEWENIFEFSGLTVVTHKAYLSKTVIQMWDIGLRPLFPVLLKMVKSINSEALPSIKEEWASILKQFIRPIIELDGQLNQGVDPAFHCFILEK